MLRRELSSLFSGSASTELTAAVAAMLGQRVGLCTLEAFPDGELSVRIGEPVRGRHVVLMQSMSPPVTQSAFQLLLLLDACKRAAASRITAIVPYLGYARADKRHKPREAIGASLLANLLQTAGLDHLVTVDLHSSQIEGFYGVPVDELTAVPMLCDELKQRIAPGTVVVSPDEGRVKMAGAYAQRLSTDVAVVHKQRLSGTETRAIKVVGEVRNRPCLIIDDMITTGGTVAMAIEALLKAGARPEITVAATHGVLVDGARAQLSHPALKEIVVTDTIAPRHLNWPELKVVPIAPLLAAAIMRLSNDESISDLWE